MKNIFESKKQNKNKITKNNKITTQNKKQNKKYNNKIKKQK